MDITHKNIDTALSFENINMHFFHMTEPVDCTIAAHTEEEAIQKVASLHKSLEHRSVKIRSITASTCVRQSSWGFDLIHFLGDAKPTDPLCIGGHDTVALMTYACRADRAMFIASAQTTLAEYVEVAAR